MIIAQIHVEMGLLEELSSVMIKTLMTTMGAHLHVRMKYAETQLSKVTSSVMTVEQ